MKSSPNSPRASRKSGFAIVIAIALMSFVLLLLVSMSTLMQVEIQTSSANLRETQARLNAIIGLQVALGELQKHAGADQRITAPATVAYPDKMTLIYGEDSLYRTAAEFVPDSYKFETYLEQGAQTYLTDVQRGDLFDDSIDDFAFNNLLKNWWEEQTIDGAWNLGDGARNPRWFGVWNTALRLQRPLTDPDDKDEFYYERYAVHQIDEDRPKFGEFMRSPNDYVVPDEQTPLEPFFPNGLFAGEHYQLPAWLVSGNEHFHWDPSRIDYYTDDGWYPEGYLTPDMNLAVDVAGVFEPYEEDDIIYLVENSVLYDDENALPSYKQSDGLDGRVRVMRQPIFYNEYNDTDDDGRPDPAGYYAYWVSDESTKANFAVHDPFSDIDPYDGSGGSITEEQWKKYRNRLQVPQRLGWEHMRGYKDAFERIQDADPNFDANDPAFLKVLSTDQIGLVDPELKSIDDDDGTDDDPAALNFHSITAYSKSLLTDNVLGGLKKDMSAYLKTDPDVRGVALNDDLDLEDFDRKPIADPLLYRLDDPRFGFQGIEREFAATEDRNFGFPDGFTDEGFLTGEAGMWPISDSGKPFEVNGEWQPGNLADDDDNALDPDTDRDEISERNMFPQWEQILNWYHNEADRADLTGTIKASGDSGPVLAGVYAWAGYSFDSPNVYFHITPVFVFWNPYSVEIEPADYTIDYGFNHRVNDLLIANAAPADTSVALPSEEGYFINDHYVYRFDVDDPLYGRDSDIFNRWIRGDADDVSENYFNGTQDDVILSTGKAAFIGLMDDTENVLTDAFDWAGNNVPNVVRHNLRYKTDDEVERLILGSGDMNVVADYVMSFSLNTGFEPGEVKVFTVDPSQGSPGASTKWVNDNTAKTINWTALREIELSNSSNTPDPTDELGTSEVNRMYLQEATIVENEMPSIYFQIAKVIEPTASSTIFSGSSQPAYTFRGQYLGGYLRTQVQNTSGVLETVSEVFLDSDSSRITIGSDRNDSGSDDIDQWAHLPDPANYHSNRIDTPSGMEVASGLVDFTVLSPFSDPGANESTVIENMLANLKSIHSHYPALSRFNIKAKSFLHNREVEAPRNASDVAIRRTLQQNTGIHSAMKSFHIADRSGNRNLTWGETDFEMDGALLTPFTGRDIEKLDSLSIATVKRPGADLLSLGQLQQVNLSPYVYQPSNPIGNSDAPIYTDREAIGGIHSRILGGQRVDTERSPGEHDHYMPANRPNNKRNDLLDISYLLNENLWDRYFLSSIPQLEALDFNEPLGNSRLRYTNSPTEDEVKDFDNAAAYMVNSGALNVNSTSVEAWKALILAFQDLYLESLQTADTNPDNTIPVTRTLFPIGDPVKYAFDDPIDDQSDIDPSTYGADGTEPDLSTVMKGFRYMTDEMAEVLAERIVDEVRIRGPFMSVADFVNRRLVAPEGSRGEMVTSSETKTAWLEAVSGASANSSENENESEEHSGDYEVDDYTGKDGSLPGFFRADYDPVIGLTGINGAIQRAINVSGLNGGVNYNRDIWDDHNPIENDPVFFGIPKNVDHIENTKDDFSEIYTNNENELFHFMIEPSRRMHVDPEHFAGVPVGEVGQLLQGAPAFISQGDILSMIGSALTARGDTFMIRTYGAAVNEATGQEDRAYLEAIVQRVYDPVDPVDHENKVDGVEPEWLPASELGRQFRIISFRWLTEDEI